MAGQLEGKVAVVTGGASGIGRASALAFAREGARVAVADVAAEGGKETARMIQEQRGEAAFIEADVSAAADVERLIADIVKRFGRLDCALNNAGIEGARAPAADYAEEEWDRVVRTNLKGVWLCMKYELRQMLKQGSGAIANVASTVAMTGSENSCAYAACSHGILGLTRSAALECAKAGIRVNGICPGTIRTPLIERVLGGRPGAEAQVAAAQPMGRMGRPEEIAATAVWLLSDAASFVTGSTLVADGGRLAR